MAFDDKRIVEIILARFKERLLQIKTKADLETFFNNLTKAKVKTFINNALEDEATKREGFGAEEVTTGGDIRAIKDYVDTL